MQGDGGGAQVRDVVRAAWCPKPVSAEEVAEHEASGHAVYRRWCQACVSGKARAAPHRDQGRTESDLPELATDFCEFRLPGGAMQKMLVLKCRSSQAFAATAVDNALADNPCTIRFVRGFFNTWGIAVL